MFNFGGPSKLDATTQMQSNSIPYHISSPVSRLNGGYYHGSNGYSTPPPPHQHDMSPPTNGEQDGISAMEQHFYQSFRTGEFSDVLFTVLFANGQPAAFNLHSIVISRSTFLRDL